ncbi:MAG: hypothetical protein JO142_17380 [Burkholderiales bacterium]|nr:hypothetical protein [Burkholderiales bacterium]
MNIERKRWLAIALLLVAEIAAYTLANYASVRVLEIDGFAGPGSAHLWYSIAMAGWGLLLISCASTIFFAAKLSAKNHLERLIKGASILILLGWPIYLHWLHKFFFAISVN